MVCVLSQGSFTSIVSSFCGAVLTQKKVNSDVFIIEEFYL